MPQTPQPLPEGSKAGPHHHHLDKSPHQHPRDHRHPHYHNSRHPCRHRLCHHHTASAVPASLSWSPHCPSTASSTAVRSTHTITTTTGAAEEEEDAARRPHLSMRQAARGRAIRAQRPGSHTSEAPEPRGGGGGGARHTHLWAPWGASVSASREARQAPAGRWGSPEIQTQTDGHGAGIQRTLNNGPVRARVFTKHENTAVERKRVVRELKKTSVKWDKSQVGQ